MSLGNINTDGDKKSNYNWQLRMLQMLDAEQKTLNAILGALGGSTIDVPYGPIRATGSGTIPANSKGFSVFNAGTADGIINGNTIKQGERFNWDGYFPSPVTYNAAGTTLVITYIL